jgi:carboxymethylenebutenolidase
MEIGLDDERFEAYRVDPLPAQGSLPGILLIQEIWGVDKHIVNVARRLARAGYLVCAPDLYSRGERAEALTRERIEAARALLDSLPQTAWSDEGARALAELPPDESERVSVTLGALFSRTGGLEVHIPALQATVRRMAEDERSNGRIASLGFCMGGSLSGLLACHEPGLSAAVIFYGSPPPSELLDQIEVPLIGFYGELDHRITDSIPDFARATEAAGKSFEHKVYSGASHAFFNDTRSSYRVDAARDSWARALAFLNRTIGGGS